MIPTTVKCNVRRSARVYRRPLFFCESARERKLRLCVFVRAVPKHAQQLLNVAPMLLHGEGRQYAQFLGQYRSVKRWTADAAW